MSEPAWLVWTRSAALLRREREALARIAEELCAAPWVALATPTLQTIEDHGPQRVMLQWSVQSLDRGLADHARLAHLACRVQRAVPASTLHGIDPLAVLGKGSGGEAVAVGGPPFSAPAAPPPAGARHTLCPPPPAPPRPQAHTAGELADICQLLRTMGPHPALLRAARPAAIRHPEALVASLEHGVLACAALHIVRVLVDASLPVPQGARSLAVRRWTDGDREERQAAAALLSVLQARRRPPAPGPPDGRDPVTIGDALLHRAAGPEGEDELLLEPEEDELLLGEGPDWEDDLALDDGEAIELVALPGTPPPAIELLRAVAPAPGLAPPAAPPAGELIAMLDGVPEERAGALVLLASGAWDPTELPGIGDALGRRLRQLPPPVLPALAAEALGRIGRRDTEAALTAALTGPEPTATAACHALRHHAGPSARRALRAALDQPGLRDRAAEVLGALPDPGAVAALEATEQTDAVLAARLRLGWQPAALPAGAGPLARAWHGHDQPTTAAELVAAGLAETVAAWPALVAAATAADPDTRTAAAVGLRHMGLRAATPVLVELALDSDLATSLAGIAALEEIGDQRAVPVLRRLATDGAARGRAASRALAAGRHLRAPAPDGRVRVKAMSRALVGPEEQRTLRGVFGGLPLRLRFAAAEISAEGHIDPERPDLLAPLAAALSTLDQRMPSLAWSARDGHGLLRRDAGAWILSTRRGEPCRNAGWFAETLPAPRPRPPLAPIDPREDALLDGAARVSLPEGEE